MRSASRLRHALVLGVAYALSSCASAPIASAPESADVTRALVEKAKTIVIIYAENEGFDKLYGSFPGANGLPPAGAVIPQTDRDAKNTVLPALPQTWGGVTAAGQSPVVTQAQSSGLPNAPFSIESAFGVPLSQATITRDLYHRFFENQMQIDGGKNDKFAAYADSGGLVMGHFDGSKMALYKIAQQFVLADDFFQGSFGGSFSNHQYLICACVPQYPNADTSPAKPSMTVLDRGPGGQYIPQLTIAATSRPSALDGPPVFVASGNIAPKNYFGDGSFGAINTMQPPYQPSESAPASSDSSRTYADPMRAVTLPPQTQVNIGDLLTQKGVSWAWYAGAWNSTLAIATSDRKFPRGLPGQVPAFQYHHQPFNYYQAFDPATHAGARAQHLKDYTDLVSDIASGTLPAVTFYKPEGDLNQHPGYSSVAAGDAHIAGLIAKLEASPQWKNMIVIVTYDENGGSWDHAAPPHGDLVGPGTRIPALIISPFAKMGTVDHTPYDTGSILRLITRRYALPLLPGLAARDAALKNNGAPPMGDLTEALVLN